MKRIYFDFCLVLIVSFLAIQTAGATQFVAEYKSNSGIKQAIADAGGKMLRNHPEVNLVIAESSNLNFAKNLSKNKNFKSVDKDVKVQWIPDNQLVGKKTFSGSTKVSAQGGADSFFLPIQWSLFVTDTVDAWSVTEGDPNVKVAVLDSGVCTHQLDLVGKVDAANSTAFATETVPECVAAVAACPTCPSWEDYRFHGTAVASLITGNNIGMSSVAGDITLRAVKVLDCTGFGSFGDVISGILYATSTGNNIINMSLGAYGQKTASGNLIGALNKAVNFAKSNGVLVISAAGNDAADLDHDGNNTSIPCQSGSGFCVGATAITDELASYSNHGVSGPQIVAPGGDDNPVEDPATGGFILAACSAHSAVLPFDCSDGVSYLIADGTSFAAPLTTGAAALIDSIAPGGPGTAKPSQIRRSLIRGADDLGKNGTDNIFSHGRLNTNNSVNP